MTALESELRRACRVVIVNWNSGARLRRCVQSIPLQFEVVIVDNASSDLTPQDPWPQNLAIIRNTQNEGFAGAANRGAAGSNREFLLFLNPDVSFANECSADSMLALLEKYPAAAAATGRLVDPLCGASAGKERRRDIPLIRPLPTLLSALSDVLFLDELLGSFMPRFPETEACRIEQAPGACLLIRRRVFEALGGFDAAFYPAWFEDVDLCRRLVNRGLEIFYQPLAVFYHEGGYSARRMGRREFNRAFYGNMVRYFRKHHGPAAALALSMAVPLGNTLRGLHAAGRSHSRPVE
ncbi:MAG: glycosyltransferase [Acidobacteria bacterium]|nr:glycosyltransferase [Acidobacteriota bacterium]